MSIKLRHSGGNTSTYIEVDGVAEETYKSPHISVSSLNTYLNCGRKLKYRKVLGFPEKTSEALVIGSTIDRYLSEALSMKKSERHPVEAILSYGVEAVKKAGDDLSEEQGDAVTNTLENLLPAIESYMKEQVPDLQPVESQKKVEVVMTGVQKPVLGFLDLFATRKSTGRFVVVDWKTSARSYSKPQESWKVQLGFYALAMAKTYGVDLDQIDLEIHGFIKLKKKPKYQVMKVDINRTDYGYILEQFKMLDKNIAEGFYPMNRDNFLCNPKFCSFYDHCHLETKKKESTLLNSITMK